MRTLSYPSNPGLVETKVRSEDLELTPLILTQEPERIVEGKLVYSTQWYFVWEKGFLQHDFYGINELAGTYVFKDREDEILYIGEATNIYNRICYEHVRGKKTSQDLYRYFWSVDIYVIDHAKGEHGESNGLGDRKSLEDILIKKLKPLHNAVKKGLRPESDLSDYLNTYASTRRRDNWDQADRDNLIKAYPKIVL